MKKILLTLTLILLLAYTTTAEWPRYGGNPENTGYTQIKSTGYDLGDIKIKWIYYTQEKITTDPITADINNQGGEETILSAGKTLHVIDSQGKPLWTYETNSTISTTPTAADIDNNGKKEIIIGTLEGAIHVIDHLGQNMWSYQAGGEITNNPIAADLENNQKKEIIFASADGNIYILDHKGNKIRAHKTTAETKTTPAIADLDGDGYKDIIYGSNDKAIHVMLWRGSIVSYQTGSNHKANPTIYEKTITAGNEAGGLFKLRLGTEYSRERFTTMRALKPVWNQTMEGEATSAAIGEQGNKTITAVGAGRNLYLLTPEGEIEARYSTNKEINQQPAIADLNNDSQLEIIITTREGETIILDSNYTAVWSHKLDSETTASPVITDLELDGRPEIITATWEGLLYVYGTAKPEPQKTTTTTVTSSSTTTTVTTTSTTTSSSSTTTTTITIPKKTTPPKAVIAELSTETIPEKKQAPTGRIIGLPLEGAGILVLMLFLAGYVYYRTRI
jgi:hypothetical protein